MDSCLISLRRKHCLTAVLSALMLAFAFAPAHAQDDAQRKAQQAQAQAKLDAVRTQIAQIAQQQKAVAAQRDSINTTLGSQAQQLDDAARALHDTDTAIDQKTASLAQLQDEQSQLQTKLATQRAALAQLLRAAYALNRGSDLSLLLGDEDVAAMARALAYSRYFQHDRVQRIRSLLADAMRLDQVKTTIDADRSALQKERDARTLKQQALQQARDAQQHLLTAADAQLSQQQDKLAALQTDEQSLNQLLEKLKDVFADIPKQLGSEQPFAQLRGKLPMPVNGAVHAGSGPLAHGVLIAAKPGSDVRAVAYGRVAWADFMRGYGELVIIDHGNGYMSLYGNNESALVEDGDWVKPDQAIATVGRGQGQAGAYFEIRKDGKPVDAKDWLKPR